MDAHVDIHLTRSDVTQDPPAESLNVDGDHTGRNEESILDGGPSLSPSEYLNLAGDKDIHAPVKEESHTERHGTDDKHSYTYLQTGFDHVILEEVLPSAVDPVSSIDASEAPTACPQDSPLLCARAISTATSPRGVDPDDRSNLVQILHTELDHGQSADSAHLADEEEAEPREDFDDGFLPSLPPSSSPPQLFSSSPCVSSQSSGSDVEQAPAIEGDGSAGSHECAHSGHAALVPPDDFHVESEDNPNPDMADEAPTFLETDQYCSQTGPSSIEDGLTLSKRTADPDEQYGPQPFKRLKLDSCLYLPPAPKRATLASQNHQFKKLSAPFRPPQRLPTTTNGLAQTVSNKKVEQTVNATPETNRDKAESTISLQHKTPNASKSVTQFKSPLVNKVLPADARTIRLTPALQALERKLQLLKRAIKVKEDEDEQVLAKLAKKWVEAGREVAYDVWDATKDVGNFEAKATSARGLRGWESADRGDIPWGWDSKPRDGGEEPCNPDPSEAVPEEDDDAACHTLGTMLRQLGIAPEIFGWDDDKETFSD